MKKGIKNVLFSFICLIQTGFICAQENNLDYVVKIVDQTKQFYEVQGSYNVEVQYVLYQDYMGSKILEDYKGVLVKNGKDFYSKIHHTESVQIKNEIVKVNHEEKAMIYSLLSKASTTQEKMGLELFLKNFEKAEVHEEDALYRIKCFTPSVTGLPYGEVVLEINKSDYRVIKQTLFFLKQVVAKSDNGKEKLTNPRLEISFNNFSVGCDGYNKKFDLATYILKGKEGNKIANQFSDYQFIDATK